MPLNPKEIQGYFIDIIDWSFLHYLEDTLVKYYDMGYYPTLVVCLNDGCNYDSIYASYYQDDQHITQYTSTHQKSLDELVNSYRKHGICYQVYISSLEMLFELEPILKFKEQVQHKCIFIKDGRVLSIRPSHN